MRHLTLLLLLFMGVVNMVKSQQTDRFCGHNAVLNHLENKAPGTRQQYLDWFQMAREVNAQRAIFSCTANVVVHVVYNNIEEDISNQTIREQIEILNKTFSFQNSDTASLRSEFFPITGNSSHIYFKLANIDPAGNPTSGIVRRQTSRNGFGNSVEFYAEDVKSSAFGGSDPWDQNRYINIWICNTADDTGMPLVAGYATPPPGLPNWPDDIGDLSDGLVIQYDFFGVTPDNPGRVTVHEMGHYFGLRHIWGDDSNCAGTDGIDDTPSASSPSFFTCFEANTCEDNINGVDLSDMYENYMDYSEAYCQVAFTNEQMAFMNWVFENKRSELCTYATSMSSVTPSKLNLFPQPASDVLETGLQQAFTFKIFSLSGAEISTGFSSHGDISVNHLSAGAYLLSVETKNEILRKLFLVQ